MIFKNILPKLWNIGRSFSQKMLLKILLKNSVLFCTKSWSNIKYALWKWESILSITNKDKDCREEIKQWANEDIIPAL